MSATQDPSSRQGVRRRRLLQLGVAAALAAVVVVAAVLAGRGGDGGGSAGPVEERPSRVLTLPEQGRVVDRLFAGIPQDGTVLGHPEAPATLIEFADLQCPFCAAFATAVLPTVVEDYVRPGKLRLDLQLLTFLGPDSRRLGLVAAAAGQQDRMWHYAEMVYRNQGEEGTGYATDAYLRRLAAAVPGLDAERAMAERNSPASARVLRRAADAAERLGADETPSFYLRQGDGKPRRVPLAELTPDAFTAALDRALRR
jgi:protein-disulfide isomerase